MEPKFEKVIYETDKAPITPSPYSQSVIYNGLIFISGQGPLKPKTNEIIGETTAEQTRATLNNIKTILEEAGSSLDKVLKVTVYLQNMCDFDEMNGIYKEYFQEKQPSRSTVGVVLDGILVEIDAIAAI